MGRNKIRWKRDRIRMKESVYRLRKRRRRRRRKRRETGNEKEEYLRD